VLAVFVLLVVISWPPLKNLFSRHQLMNASFNRWHLVNAYGAFGSITRPRYEVVIEGSLAESPGEGDWLAYEFHGKPGDPRRVPRQFAPYHLRLDWLMWFLPLGHSLEDWFTTFLVKLLEADRPTLRLLAHDPFDGTAPRWVRAVSYRYRFTGHAEFRESRQRWHRDRRRPVIGPVALRRTGRLDE